MRFREEDVDCMFRYLTHLALGEAAVGLAVAGSDSAPDEIVVRGLRSPVGGCEAQHEQNGSVDDVS